MKKNSMNWIYLHWYVLRKALFVMKLTALIFLISTLSLIAGESYSQDTRISLNMKNVQIKDVLLKIENTSEFFFIYNNQLVDVDRNVSIAVDNEKISSVLQDIFHDQNMEFQVTDRKIVIAPTGVQNSLTQGGKVTGKITDSTGAPLPGVAIVLKGTTNGSITDGNGDYAISNVKSGSTLQFSFVGMKKQEIIVGSKTTINVVLEDESFGLEEVVAVGYGTQKKISLTGAVDAVSTTKAIVGRPVTNVTQALEGNSPGLFIQQRNYSPTREVYSSKATYNINIRGTGTTGDNDPLIVIDGIIGGNMNSLNPSDIESISILKDAGSAAIYGSRSANGVILIVTKKGKLGSEPIVTVSSMFGVQVPDFMFNPVSGWENMMDKNMSLIHSGSPARFTDAQIAAQKAKGDGNWRLETLIHNAPQNTQNVTISGGGAHSTYLASFGYFDQRSGLEASELSGSYGQTRYNFRLNETMTFGKFNSSWNLAYAKVKVNSPYNEVFGDAMRAPLTDSFQDAQGNYITGFVTSNPLALLRKGGYYDENNDEINGSFTLGYNITPALKIKALFGGTVIGNWQKQRTVQVNYYPSGNSNSGRQTRDNISKSLATNVNLIAEYTKTFGQHDLSILIGAANESYESSGAAYQQSQTDPLLGVATTGTLQDAGSSNNWLNNFIETSLNSYFGRASYSYAKKYYLDATFRADASSNFPKNGRWGYFPSIGGSWRLTEESFMSNIKDKVGEIRLRANYGVLGNQSVSAYQYRSTYSTNTNVYAFNNTAAAGATQNLANPDLTWEKAVKLDIGADVTILQGKLTFGADYFSNITRDILATRQDVPTLFGSGFPSYNVAKVQNRGWEVKVSYATKGTFSQNITFSISDALSKLLALGGGQTEQVFQREEFEYVRRVGLPITTYQGYKTDGLYQTQAQVDTHPKFAGATVTLGDWMFKDKNGDGVIDTKDKYNLGNPFPRFMFGFNYSANYKNFDIGILVQGVFKRDMLIRGELIEPYHFNDYGGTVYDSSSDFWTPQNTGAKYPRLAERGSASNNNNFRTGSDMYLFSGAYARLKNVQIGYSLPTSILSKLHIDHARIYVTGQNLLTISPLKFADPEGGEFGNTYDITSIANSPRGYPTPTFYGGGLEFSF
ncbi:MAG TPA: TonB-dependent receptor [Prolixibacteraceae bacterium]|nr:TonB-dependent receptor [Prolixibacteraceae bacterium]